MRTTKKSVKPEAPVEKPKFPFKVGQVICSLKIVSIDPDAERGIGFKEAVRRDQQLRNEKGEVALAPKALVRDQRTGKVIWGDLVRQMSLEDFTNMIKSRRQTEADVE